MKSATSGATRWSRAGVAAFTRTRPEGRARRAATWASVSASSPRMARARASSQVPSSVKSWRRVVRCSKVIWSWPSSLEIARLMPEGVCDRRCAAAENEPVSTTATKADKASISIIFVLHT